MQSQLVAATVPSRPPPGLRRPPPPPPPPRNQPTQLQQPPQKSAMPKPQLTVPSQSDVPMPAQTAAPLSTESLGPESDRAMRAPSVRYKRSEVPSTTSTKPSANIPDNSPEARARLAELQSLFGGAETMVNRILVREGALRKCNRDGKFDSLHFILTSDALIYCKPQVLGSKLTHHRTIPLLTMIAKYTIYVFVTRFACVSSGFMYWLETAKKDQRMLTPAFEYFRSRSHFMSKQSQQQRSRNGCRILESSAGMKTYLSRTWLSLHKVLLTRHIGTTLAESETAALRVINRTDIRECQVCQRGFGMFDRRHHCRNWYAKEHYFMFFVISLRYIFFVQRKVCLRRLLPRESAHRANRPSGPV